MTNFLLLVLAKGVDLGTNVLRSQLIHGIDILRDAAESLLLVFDLLLGRLDVIVEAFD